jgi:hypothetical protein
MRPLIKKGQEDPSPPRKRAARKAKAAPRSKAKAAAPKTSYYTFSDDFTSNLKQSTALVPGEPCLLHPPRRARADVAEEA